MFDHIFIYIYIYGYWLGANYVYACIYTAIYGEIMESGKTEIGDSKDVTFSMI